MPVIKGITVSVFTKNGPLTEYGTKRIGSSSIFSTFIQSEDKTPFWIDFMPSVPFDYNTSPELKRTRRKANTNAPSWKSPSGTWDFSAHIFIDGNLKPDKNLIIDLPRYGLQLNPVVTARGRSCVNKNGISSEQHWMFKEVPVEDQLAMLTTDESTEDDEWEMISDDGTKPTQNVTSMGQIKINLFRIRQRGTDLTRANFRRLEIPAEQSRANLGIDISHTVRVGAAKPRNFQYVSVDYLDSPSEPWATIIFMYRGKKQLQKMGFITRKDLPKNDHFAIFEPGPSRQFGTNRVGCIDESGKSNGPEYSSKGRGASRSPSRMAPTSEDDRTTGVKTGQHLTSTPLLSGPRDLPITSPKPLLVHNLKRKPERPDDIAIDLSFMSLGSKAGLKPIKNLEGFNNSGRKSPWKMRVQRESTSDDELACLKRLKVKKGYESEEDL